MTALTRPRRSTLAVGSVATALFAASLMATPAFAATTPLTQVEFTDGVTTGDEATFAGGSDVTFVLNGSNTGDFDFVGCWAVSVDGAPTTGPATAAAMTWTAGTAVDTVFTTVNLSPAADTVYDIYVWRVAEPGMTCDYDNATDRVAYLTIEITAAPDSEPDPESMTLTGTAKRGSTVTVTAKIADSLVGNDFDLWACPDQTVSPTDDAAEGANGECVGPFIQPRNGNATQFVLGYDPVRDAENTAAQAFWDSVCGKYFIVHDYPGGGHSNWIGPVACDETESALAATGPDAVSGAISLAALAAMAGGVILLLVRRHAGHPSR